MVCESAPVRDLIATSKGFLKMSLQYDLWCKMQFFGEDIERANQEGERIGTRGPRNLLELLPDEFTIEDAKRVRKQQGMNESRTKKMIAIWKSRHYVSQISDFSFIKSDKFKIKH